MSALAQTAARNLLAFIDASPSPWHAVASMESQLQAHGFVPLSESERWSLQAGGKYYVARQGSSLIAFILGQENLASGGLRLIGAHTDSPGLRLKPRPAEDAQGVSRLGVEVYGGPILATFADRDLGLAGRVQIRTPDGYVSRLVHFDRPILRLPNLAIHMNREVNETGLRFNKQNELPLVFGISQDTLPAVQRFRELLGEALTVDQADVLTWDLLACDTQKGSLWGPNQEFMADSQLDNLASCHAALSALCAQAQPRHTALCAFFDHEEVGSESAVGAGGSFLVDVLQRLAAKQHLDEEDRQRMMGNSFFISADMAHAWHPNFPAAYEPCHRVMVNAGPVIKSNANQRYASNADSAARFIGLCETAGVPWQQYAHRSDLGCGSTIGPILAASLGLPSVDVGAPMWAMHSIRESAGVADHDYMIRVFTAALAD